MNEQDAEFYFDALREVLRKNQLDWVLEQISEQIRLGKLEEREITPYKESNKGFRSPTLFGVDAYTKGKKEKFQVIVPYTPQERLSLLVSSIQKLFIDSADMQIEVANLFAIGNNHINSIKFVDTENEEATFTITPGENLNTIKAQSNRLYILLDEISKDAGEL